MSAASPLADSWTPASWRGFPAAQQPIYADRLALAGVERDLAAAAPIVSIEDCAGLRALSLKIEAGDGFILQGGDCAESLGQPQAPVVDAIVDLYDALGIALPRPLINIARIAGQFAKPRSSPIESRGAITLPAYRGDGINGSAFTAGARDPDPARMIAIHAQSVETAQLLATTRTARPPIFTSHEALLLPYEQALARCDAEGRWWATSGHMLWIGDRSRQVGGAHVEFAAGIENLVGVKCGPSLGGGDLLRLLDRLDPANRSGKVALIGRFGAGAIERHLPALMQATRRNGRRVLWMIDPMHGNGRIEAGRKMRRMDDMLAETRAFFDIAFANDIHPAGLHLEMSADDVSECAGADDPVAASPASHSLCDPRLNRAQAVGLVQMVAGLVPEPA